MNLQSAARLRDPQILPLKFCSYSEIRGKNTQNSPILLVSLFTPLVESRPRNTDTNKCRLTGGANVRKKQERPPARRDTTFSRPQNN